MEGGQGMGWEDRRGWGGGRQEVGERKGGRKERGSKDETS